MKRPLLALAVGALLYATLCSAKPASWYLWRSDSASNFICAQISPGEGWVAFKGPFKDSHCKKPGDPR